MKDINDKQLGIQKLKNIINDFNKERDWEQFHDLKNLSMAITIESTELMEHFLWCDNSESQKVLNKNRIAIEDEVADIAIILINFCNMAKIDLANAVLRKLEINKAKYPVSLCKGRANKYNNLGGNDA